MTIDPIAPLEPVGPPDPIDPTQSPPAESPPGCENCGAALQGEYCHACGQSVHNPIRHAGHALEEVFESFWHLDGRVFRTLRDLPIPARVACDYIGGHRARYIAPLRLFVVLSLLTFFVGQMTVDFSNDAVQFEGDDDAIAAADTVAEVEQRRDAALRALTKARAEAPRVPGLAQGLGAAEAEVHTQAAERIAELRRATATTAPGQPGVAAPSGAPPPKTAVAATDAVAGDVGKNNDLDFTLPNGRPWHEQTNPLTVAWLPAFANRWLNHKVARAIENAPRLRNDAEARKRVILGSVPTALFVLMPVFALLLKLAYIGKRRLYLEHLVVALYSHAFLLLALLTVFVLVGLENWLAPRVAGAGSVLGWLEIALWWSMPIYLLIMQKRVYGQGWIVTALKYFVLGAVYLMLVMFAALIAGAAGLAKL